MSQKGAQRAFIGPELPSGPSRTARQVDQIGQTQKKKKKSLPPPLLELKGTSEKYSNSSHNRSGQAGKVWFQAMSNLRTQIRGQPNLKSRSFSDTSHCTKISDKKRGSY